MKQTNVSGNEWNGGSARLRERGRGALDMVNLGRAASALRSSIMSTSENCLSSVIL